MRKLMWFTIGFGVACAFCAYWQWEHLWLMALMGSLLGAAGWIAREKWKWMRCLVAVCLGFSLGIGWFLGYDEIQLQSAADLDGKSVSLAVTAVDYSAETERGCSVESRIKIDGKVIGVKLYLNEMRHLKPGDLVSGVFRLRATHGGAKESTYHRGDGILLMAYQRGSVTVQETEQVPLRYLPAALRYRLIGLINDGFPEDVAFFARALLLGDRSGVDYETSTVFKVSGISHIIAVSGLHVSILFAVIFLVSGRKKVLTSLIGIPAILLFAAVAGFTPSITRACIMQILMMTALLFDREYDPPTALAFAALCMLVYNPLVITSVSFQLSVGCMAGIFLFSEKIKKWISGFWFWKDKKGKTLAVRLRQGIAGGAAITLSAMFFTTPLVAYYFGAVSLIGVATNLLTLWAVSLIFYGIMAVCLLALFWKGAAVALAWAAAWLIRYVMWVAGFLAGLPFAAVYTKSVYIVLWLGLCYGLLMIFLVVKSRRPWLLIGCGTVGLCLSLILSWVEPAICNYRVTVFDVGQGQCILLQADGRSFLVDCGGDYDDDASDLAAETLLSMGITHLDGVIVTHYDRDHAGGVAGLLSRVPADAVFLPDTADEEQLLPAIIEKSDGRHVFVREDTELDWADNLLTVYAPVSRKSGNESGLTVLFRAGNCDILITGDLSTLGESILVGQKELPDLTALVVGHHGSRSSTGEKLLSETRPELAFISVGADNAYGHPSDVTLERLAEYGCMVYRTDRDGTIVLKG